MSSGCAAVVFTPSRRAVGRGQRAGIRTHRVWQRPNGDVGGLPAACGSARCVFARLRMKERRSSSRNGDQGMLYEEDDDVARMKRITFSARNPRRDVFKEVD